MTVIFMSYTCLLVLNVIFGILLFYFLKKINFSTLKKDKNVHKTLHPKDNLHTIFHPKDNEHTTQHPKNNTCCVNKGTKD